MTYDEAISKLDEIVGQMETDEALSMEEYKQRAKQAKELIKFCQQQLTGMEQQMKEAVE